MKILCVCLGNICRSPMAEAVMSHISPDGYHIDSAGTSGWHDGKSAHIETLNTLRNHGIKPRTLISRQIKKKDFIDFDYILVMDQSNYNDCIAIAPKEFTHKIHFYLEFKVDNDKNMPDPWYTGNFEETYQLSLQGAQYWFNKLIEKKDSN